MSDTTPEPTADERLAQIRDRNHYLAQIPFETHGGGIHGPHCPPCELVRAIDDVKWLLKQLDQTRTDTAPRQPENGGDPR